MASTHPLILLDAVGASVEGEGFQLHHTSKDFTFALDGSATTATIFIDGSLDGVQWFTIGNLYKPPSSPNIFHSTDKPFAWLRARSYSDVTGGVVTVKVVYV
jgi:hypothetical protein